MTDLEVKENVGPSRPLSNLSLRGFHIVPNRPTRIFSLPEINRLARGRGRSRSILTRKPKRIGTSGVASRSILFSTYSVFDVSFFLSPLFLFSFLYFSVFLSLQRFFRQRSLFIETLAQRNWSYALETSIDIPREYCRYPGTR